MSFVNGVSVGPMYGGAVAEPDEKSGSHHHGQDEFSLVRVRDYLVASSNSQGEVDLKTYLDVFQELLKFIASLGRLYAFVASDMEYKVNVLSNLMKKDPSNYGGTVQKMVDYEMGPGKSVSKREGTKNFLWIHRAMEFIVNFFQALRVNVIMKHRHEFSGSEIKMDFTEEEANKWAGKPSNEIAWQVYMATLGQHHAWITHQLVHLATFAATPSTEHLLQLFGGEGKSNLLHLNEIVSDIVGSAHKNFSLLDAFFDSKQCRLLY